MRAENTPPLPFTRLLAPSVMFQMGLLLPLGEEKPLWNMVLARSIPGSGQGWCFHASPSPPRDMKTLLMDRIRKISVPGMFPGVGRTVRKCMPSSLPPTDQDFSSLDHFVGILQANPKSDRSVPFHPDPIWGSGSLELASISSFFCPARGGGGELLDIR